MKKGQAAMEFLMTYGWAILVVLAAVAALAFFGVLSPQNLLPDKCLLPTGITCVDAAATSTDLTMVITNDIGFEMSNVTVSAEGCSTPANDASMLNREQTTFKLTNCTFTSGAKLDIDVNVTYTKANSGLSHVGSGSVVKTVQ